MVTRLAEQKGIDLLFDALPALLQAREFRFGCFGQRRAEVRGIFYETWRGASRAGQPTLPGSMNRSRI